jgi:hypothetical protein
MSEAEIVVKELKRILNDFWSYKYCLW